MPLPTPTSMQGALGSDGRWKPPELELLEKLVNYDQGKHLGLHFSLRNILRIWNERYLWTKHGTMSPSLMVLSQVLQRPKCSGPFPSKQRGTHDNNKYISSMILEVIRLGSSTVQVSTNKWSENLWEYGFLYPVCDSWPLPQWGGAPEGGGLGRSWWSKDVASVEEAGWGERQQKVPERKTPLAPQGR